MKSSGVHARLEIAHFLQVQPLCCCWGCLGAACGGGEDGAEGACRWLEGGRGRRLVRFLARRWGVTRSGLHPSCSPPTPTPPSP